MGTSPWERRPAGRGPPVGPGGGSELSFPAGRTGDRLSEWIACRGRGPFRGAPGRGLSQWHLFLVQRGPADSWVEPGPQNDLVPHLTESAHFAGKHAAHVPVLSAPPHGSAECLLR